MNTRALAIKAHKVLLNGSGKLSFFERRGISEETIRAAWVGYDATSRAFTYPCIASGGGLLGIHYKGERRDQNGKRRQRWGGYAEDLPPKGHGKAPDDPAKVIPFGLETLTDPKTGRPVLLCCGEEDALSVRQAGYTGVSQAGAGLLEPAYARAFEGLEVVVFYDAGEENEARMDATKLLEAGAKSASVVAWPMDAPHGSDINGKLVEDPEGFEGWLADMIATAKPPNQAPADDATRDGSPDAYVPPVPQTTAWPVLAEEALCGLPGDVVKAIPIRIDTEAVREALSGL